MARQSRPRTTSAPSATDRRSRLVALGESVTTWARDVVESRIVSGELMRQAAERHLRDLESGRHQFRPEEAGRAMDFFPSVLTVTSGTKAGQPFHLPGYMGFVVGSLFGWYRADGRLRYREAWLELGKGMVKTPLAAAIGLYVMGWRGVQRSEVYAIAKDRNQASVLFNDAVALCRAPIPGIPHESLESRGDVVLRGTGNMTWMIEHPASSSMFRLLANDEKISGPRPSLVAGDEIHEWSSMAQIELWRAALVKMAGDGLLIMTTNTPAADQIAATEQSEYFQNVLRGAFQDESSFVFIARVDKSDKPLENEACWKKALPLLDITFPAENVRDAVTKSRNRISTQLSTKRLYFGVPVGASSWWIDVDAWEEVQEDIDEEEMVGLDCYLSLDLSQKNDLTALGKTWSCPDGLVRQKISYWKPRDNLAEAATADGAQYVEWAEPQPRDDQPYLSLTNGRTIEYEFVAAEVQRTCVRHRVAAMAFDPAHIGEFRKACDRIGFQTWIYEPDEPQGVGLKLLVHSQGRGGMNSKRALWMPRSVSQLEDLILDRDIRIDRSPITTWCCGNAAIETDAQNNKFFVKKRIRGRIDGMVVSAMGVGLESIGGVIGAPQREKTFQMFAVG